MAESEERKCPRDCKRCSLQQQMYCSAQIALSTMDMVKSLSDRFDAIVGQINGLVGQVNLAAPIAQEEEAVQTIDSSSKKTKNYEL